MDLKIGYGAIITWENYLLILTYLRYYTASKDSYKQFWLKFFNPNHQPEIAIIDIYENLEELVRGTYTKFPTLISEKFASSFCLMLKRFNLSYKDKKAEQAFF